MVKKMNAQAKRMKACKGKTGGAFRSCAGLGSMSTSGKKRKPAKKSKKTFGDVEGWGQICRQISKGPHKGEVKCTKVSSRGKKTKSGFISTVKNPKSQAQGFRLANHPAAKKAQKTMVACAKQIGTGHGAQYRPLMTKCMLGKG